MKEELRVKTLELIKEIENFEADQLAQRKSKERLEKSIESYQKELGLAEQNLEVCSNATQLLQGISATSMAKTYRFIEENVNMALERIFPTKVRKIRLEETTLRGYPQLELNLIVEDGIKRSISDSSGHGIAQIISVLCNLCLVVIRGSRRLIVLDEVISGLDKESREIFEKIMWDFTTIGFQFISVEHGFTPPEGAHVIQLAEGPKGSYVEKEYIQKSSSPAYEVEYVAEE